MAQAGQEDKPRCRGKKHLECGTAGWELRPQGRGEVLTV